MSSSMSRRRDDDDTMKIEAGVIQDVMGKNFETIIVNFTVEAESTRPNQNESGSYLQQEVMVIVIFLFSSAVLSPTTVNGIL